MYLSGSKELDKDVSSNRGVAGDAKPLPRERTITEALKITKPDSQSSDCLHFLENADIIESSKGTVQLQKCPQRHYLSERGQKANLDVF